MSKEPTYTCPNCGGDIIGDGYYTAQHCEFADEEDYEFNEPDAPIIYCKTKSDSENNNELSS